MSKNNKRLDINEIKALHGGYWRYPILDFYYLYNHYFPTKNLVSELQEKLPFLVDNYPSTQRVVAKLLSQWQREEYFKQENLIVGNGSSELIKVLCQIVDKITVPVPTFNEWADLSESKLNIFRIDEKDKFRIDIERLIGSMKKNKSNFVAICNPNNPVGNVVDSKEIETLLKTGKFVTVDEAFIDFCPQFSVEKLVAEYHNLIVIKSCGKSMGFPGIRLGYLLTSNVEIKNKVKKLLPIWNINSIAEFFIEIFPKYKEDYKKSIKKTIRDREDLNNKIKEVKFLESYESYANFIFCRTSISASKLAKVLYEKHNILIKNGLNQSYLDTDQYVRIGVKTPKENNFLVEKLRSIKFS